MKMKNIYVDRSLKFKLKNKFNNMYMFINLRIFLFLYMGYCIRV